MRRRSLRRACLSGGEVGKRASEEKIKDCLMAANRALSVNMALFLDIYYME